MPKRLWAPTPRIPPKAISNSGGKPLTIPEGNRSGVGAKRRWHFDVAKTDQNRQAECVRSEAEERVARSERGAGKGAAALVPASALKRPEREAFRFLVIRQFDIGGLSMLRFNA
jgi:hypothetical protein